ncbi:hypothetical protein B9Z19DRAFT_309709 [Tuber borchii]|uniref:Uncharacterized protein n=1 Tax=Tuber borchii TaxID=42251 RepID=A0A2T6ZK01_TUBBO|nr:hypothetical protein B9Z19DRAFT_309709 [Tuber borchii]
MSDIQATQDSLENSPTGSPAQSYRTIFPSDSASSAGIPLNSNPPAITSTTPRNIHQQKKNLSFVLHGEPCR